MTFIIAIIIFFIVIFLIMVAKGMESDPKDKTEDSLNKPLVSVYTPKPQKVVDYVTELEGIRECFGKLYKTRVQGTDECFNFNLDAEMPVGVYYGLTQFTGETNRAGTKAVAFHKADGTLLAELDRDKWKKYEKDSNDTDSLKWLGYYNGEILNIRVYKDKATERGVVAWLESKEREASDAAFRAELERRVERMDLPEGGAIAEKSFSKYGEKLPYTGRYHIAGITHYVDSPFVAFGFARLEPDNKYNPKAVAIITTSGEKVGYISEKQLMDFYAETGGADKIPLVVEAHYYEGKLYGWLFTFSRNKKEYPYMVDQFLWALKDQSNTIFIQL